MNATVPFSAMHAADRAEAVLDADTFAPLIGAAKGLPFVAGSGFLGGAPVLIAVLDGHLRGGTIGVAEAGLLARLAQIARSGRVRGRRPVALVLVFDTGGVRVEEGPRALAAASGVGVALARLTLLGVRVAAVITGPRGCFGAPAVMAALPERIIMTDTAQWGLTGPKLLRDLRGRGAEAGEPFRATAAANRLANGDAHVVVPDAPEAIRNQLCEFVARIHAGRDSRTLEQRLVASCDTATALAERWRQTTGPATALEEPAATSRRRRDLMRYSFGGRWLAGAEERRAGLVHAALGAFGGGLALSIIVGPEEKRGGGVGLEEAAVVTDMVRRLTAVAGSDRGAILIFLFCQGHAVDVIQEQCGLHRALAECLRCLVAARLQGHPIISVLGGGTYGAAYLSLAAPSHRILAMRGTSVAPMAPQVLRAFQALRGLTSGADSEAHLAELIPDVRTVESVIRLPRILAEELHTLRGTVSPAKVPRDDS